MQRPFIHPYAYGVLILLFFYYYCYKTVATDNVCRARLSLGVGELTNHLLSLTNIFGSPCVESINWVLLSAKTVARSSILVGHQYV